MSLRNPNREPDPPRAKSRDDASPIVSEHRLEVDEENPHDFLVGLFNEFPREDGATPTHIAVDLDGEIHGKIFINKMHATGGYQFTFKYPQQSPGQADITGPTQTVRWEVKDTQEIEYKSGQEPSCGFIAVLKALNENGAVRTVQY